MMRDLQLTRLDPTSNNVYGSSCRNNFLLLHSSCSAQLCLLQHQRCLHAPSRTALHLPWWKGLLLRYVSCPSTFSHLECHFNLFTASVIWGLIGPQRIFSPGQIYSGLFWFFGVGAITPLVIYFSARKWPSSPIKYLMAPLIFGGASAIPPASPLNYLTWGIVGFIFQKVIRQRYFAWWSRLNFLTSSGLDLGLALSTLFIFFAFTMTNVQAPVWWGNTVVTSTLDANDAAVQAVVAAGEHFGPAVW
jgi:hypothetical protein